MATTPPERIEVANLVLRRERLGDEALIAHAVEANLEHLRPWMPWATATAAEVSAQRARLASAEQSWKAGSDYTYALLNHVGSRVLGVFGLHRRIGPRAIEMGYWLSHDVVGRGYATAAAEALTTAAMNHCGIDRIEIHCDEANHRSQKIPQRLGYVLDRVEADDIEAPGETGRSMIWVFSQRQ